MVLVIANVDKWNHVDRRVQSRERRVTLLLLAGLVNRMTIPIVNDVVLQPLKLFLFFVKKNPTVRVASPQLDCNNRTMLFIFLSFFSLFSHISLINCNVVINESEYTSSQTQRI
jgi:hypothetical protein